MDTADKNSILLERVARAVEKNNTLLERLLREDAGGAVCPVCQSENVRNTSTMGKPELTCYGCGGSWTPEREEVAGG